MQKLTLYHFLQQVQEYQRNYFLYLQIIISTTTCGINTLIIANDGDYRMFTATSSDDEPELAQSLQWIKDYICECLDKKKNEISQTIF